MTHPHLSLSLGINRLAPAVAADSRVVAALLHPPSATALLLLPTAAAATGAEGDHILSPPPMKRPLRLLLLVDTELLERSKGCIGLEGGAAAAGDAAGDVCWCW